MEFLHWKWIFDGFHENLSQAKNSDHCLAQPINHSFVKINHRINSAGSELNPVQNLSKEWASAQIPIEQSGSFKYQCTKAWQQSPA